MTRQPRHPGYDKMQKKNILFEIFVSFVTILFGLLKVNELNMCM